MASTSADGSGDLTGVQEAVAESIIKYNLTSQGSTYGHWIKNEDGTYTVYYKDATGRELTQLYQYKTTDGTVTVEKVEMVYEPTDGVQTDYSKDHNGNETKLPPEKAPVTSYEILEKGDGQEPEIVITVKGQKYTDPARQINPDGTISYILDEGKSSGIRKLFTISADGKVSHYTEYKVTNGWLNNSDGDTKVNTYTVNGESYTVAGGTDKGLFQSGKKYAAVEDEDGKLHKLTVNGLSAGGNAQLVLRTDDTSHFYYQIDGEGTYYKINTSDLVLRKDANGNYGLYVKGSDTPKYTLTIGEDASYTQKTTTTTYDYERKPGNPEAVIGHDQALNDLEQYIRGHQFCQHLGEHFRR